MVTVMIVLSLVVGLASAALGTLVMLACWPKPQDAPDAVAAVAGALLVGLGVAILSMALSL